MPQTAAQPPIPPNWKRSVQSALLRVISLAQIALTAAQAKVSGQAGIRQSAEWACREQEIRQLQEELRIKDARWRRVAPAKRPHYSPTERLATLELQAARGWNAEQTAARFFVTPATISAWMSQLDQGDLLQTASPINKFPDFVRYAVQRLKVLCPTMGTMKIAETLCRAGLHLGRTTVRRILKERPRREPEFETQPAKKKNRKVKSNRPNHVWFADLTVVPTALGFWVPWLPHSVLLRWPFCWWVCNIKDHHSRRVMGSKAFEKQPTSEDVTAFLAKVIRDERATPSRLITDHGVQFDCDHFVRWCKRRKIRLAFGAIGQRGSIAIIERFHLSLKNELTRKIMIPLDRRAFQVELDLYRTWFNSRRPHMGLDGATPNEVYFHRQRANQKPRLEPRPNWPRGSPCASPQAKVKGKCGVKFTLHVRFEQGRAHLPIVTFRKAA